MRTVICLLPGVLAHPSRQAYQEWAHRLVLVAGAMVVGAWIVQEGKTRDALRWFAGSAVLIGLLCIEWTFRHGFLPASPLGLNKNFVGAQLGAALVVLSIARVAVGLSQRFWLLTIIVIVGGCCAPNLEDQIWGQSRVC